MRVALVLALAMLASIGPAQLLDAPRRESDQQRLPEIAPAPAFALISQDLRGKVAAVTFIYTLCGDTCPVLTPMMALVADRFGRDFGRKVAFVSITIDPERDTPDMLKLYAQAYGADVPGWSFLTGDPAAIKDLTRRYAVFASKNPDGGVEHSSLTSLIDSRGVRRVQYLGVRFDPEEFRRDILSLIEEQ